MILQWQVLLTKKYLQRGLGFECPDNMYLLGYVTDEEAKHSCEIVKLFCFHPFMRALNSTIRSSECGSKKVVVSDIPVMHEIFGETANYINPVKNEKISVLHDIQRDVLNKYAWSLSAKNAGIAMAINWEWEKRMSCIARICCIIGIIVTILFYLWKFKIKNYIFSPFNISVLVLLFVTLIMPFFFTADMAWIALGITNAKSMAKYLSNSVIINVCGLLILF